MIGAIILRAMTGKARAFAPHIDGEWVDWDAIAELPLSGGELAMVNIARALNRGDECLDDTNRALILNAVQVMHSFGAERREAVEAYFPAEASR